MLASGQRVAACVAPSFPAEFIDMDHTQMVGMLRKLGFSLVVEVAFGADLVARDTGSSCCRATATATSPRPARRSSAYVERYYPELVGSLAPIVSPMVATARALRDIYGDGPQGRVHRPVHRQEGGSRRREPWPARSTPCSRFPSCGRCSPRRASIRPHVEPSDFDPPRGAAGGLFPISRGMLQAANLREDLLTGEIVATQGRSHVLEAIKEFADGDLGAKLLEVLCCEGCIMGAGLTNDLPLFNRRRRVRTYVDRAHEDLRSRALAARHGGDVAAST